MGGMTPLRFFTLRRLSLTVVLPRSQTKRAKNVSGVNKNEKKELLDKLDVLDKRAEASLLSMQVDLKQFLHNQLSQQLREQELKWYQRSKAKHLL
jgi:hypothetical protein